MKLFETNLVYFQEQGGKIRTETGIGTIAEYYMLPDDVVSIALDNNRWIMKRI